MPEGPEIKIAADKIAKAIAHKPIQEISFVFDHLKPYERILSHFQSNQLEINFGLI